MAQHIKTPPANPLVDQNPVDTLLHIQAVLVFLQENSAKATGEAELTPHESLVNTGQYAILKIVNDALDYEIDRLDHLERLRVVK